MAEEKMVTRYLRDKVSLPFEGKLVFQPANYYHGPRWGVETICVASGVAKFEEISEDAARRLARWVATNDDIVWTHEWGKNGIGREARWFVDRHESELSVYDNYPEAARRNAYWLNCEANRLEEKVAEEVKEMRKLAKHLEGMAFSESTKGI